MAGRRAIGTKLKIGDGASTETFDTIANLTSVGGPELQQETLDVTALDSPSNYREMITTFKSGGSVPFEMNFDPENTTHEQALTDYESQVRRNFEIEFPVATGKRFWRFAAYISQLSPSGSTDSALTMSGSLTIDGPVVRATT